MLILSSYPLLQVEISEPAEGPVGLAGLMRFQQSSDEMTGSTAWVKEIPTWSPMADYYISQDEAGEPVKPVETKLDYTVFDYKTFAAEFGCPQHGQEEVYYFNAAETDAAALIFNHFYYPGWNAYLLDGEHGRRWQQLPIIPEDDGYTGPHDGARCRPAKVICCWSMKTRRRARSAAHQHYDHGGYWLIGGLAAGIVRSRRKQ